MKGQGKAAASSSSEEDSEDSTQSNQQRRRSRGGQRKGSVVRDASSEEVSDGDTRSVRHESASVSEEDFFGDHGTDQSHVQEDEEDGDD